jgi:hypothetical protein
LIVGRANQSAGRWLHAERLKIITGHVLAARWLGLEALAPDLEAGRGEGDQIRERGVVIAKVLVDPPRTASSSHGQPR